jgi:putative ABC transport system permease protein
VQYRRVTPEYFRALRIPILRGRTFDRRDSPQGTQVAIVSRLFADRFWPGADPIGRRIRRGASPVWSVVVGVVDDVRDVALDQAPVETVYTSQLQSSAAVAPVSLVVRTSGDPASFVPAIKRAVWTIDPGQPLANVVTMEQFLAKTLGPQRFRSLLVAACGVVGLLLAAIGTYGMTARAVSERTKEVGIRLALGGSRGAVWWTVASSGVRAVSAGAAAGVVIALAAGAGLRALLPGLTGHVGWWSAGAAAVLVAAGTVAAMAAARAATMVEPLRALRAD